MMKKLTVIGFSALLGACSLLPQKNVAGTYQGDLPCADCEKIQAELILNADSTYQYNTVYFKKGKQYPFQDKGKFVRDANKPNIIRLDEKSSNLTFQINENDAEICGIDGQVVKNSNHNYKLTKTK